MKNEETTLLAKYLDDECSKEELEEVFQLLTDTSKPNDLSDLLEKVSQKFQSKGETALAHREQAWSRIKAEIEAKQLDVPFYNQWWLKIAASMALIIGIAFYTMIPRESDFVTEIPTNTNLKTVKNELGQKSRLILPDGSTVLMNSRTSITYSEEFRQDERSVVINGEAFFDVTEDPNHPFVVEVGGIKTRVLGTTFNIRAYEYYGNVKISLSSGKIVLELPNDQELILTPGQEVIFDIESGSYEMDNFDSDLVLGWQTGILHFDQASEPEVVKILEHWYNVRINTIHSNSNDWEHLTAKFDNESLENVLISLGYTLDFNFEIDGNEITINYNN